jgi:hypothetical protein
MNGLGECSQHPAPEIWRLYHHYYSESADSMKNIPPVYCAIKRFIVKKVLQGIYFFLEIA